MLSEMPKLDRAPAVTVQLERDHRPAISGQAGWEFPMGPSLPLTLASDEEKRSVRFGLSRVSPAGVGETFRQAPKTSIKSATQGDTTFSLVIEKIGSLCSLPSNWDSRGALKVNTDVAVRSLNLISELWRPGLVAPNIVPRPNGGIQFEWHRMGIDIEVSDNGDRGFEAFVGNLNTGEEMELSLPQDKDRLLTVLDSIC